MKRFILLGAVFIASIAIILNYISSSSITGLISASLHFLNKFTTTSHSQAHSLTQTRSHAISMSRLNGIKNLATMSSSTTTTTTKSLLPHAKILPRRSSERGHADHGWLNSYHTFSFADYYDPRYMSFGSIRVLNEDRVAGGTGFPTHPHRDAEIFSYILDGELTHRDSMIKKGAEGSQGDDFYRMKRGDVQFTTGGKGIAHSEQNESDKEVHFLQIWALPWSRGLTPRYHTRTFAEADKRAGFVPILSPLKAGKGASEADEKAAEPSLPGTIPIHADVLMGAGILGKAATFRWLVGIGSADNALTESGTPSDAITRSKTDRKVYVHLPMCKGGKARVRLDGREDVVLGEGDGAFVSDVKAGDMLAFENVGEVEAEIVVLDSD